MKLPAATLTFISLALATGASPASPTDEALKVLRTACVSGEESNLSAELGGLVTLRKRGVTAGITLSQEEARGLTKGLSGSALAEDLKGQRECMKQHIARVLDVSLQSSPATVDEGVPLSSPTSKSTTSTSKTPASSDAFVIPSEVTRLFAFSQRVDRDGRLREVIEWPSMSPPEFRQKIYGLMQFSRRRGLKLIITAKTSESNWGAIDGVRYKGQPLKRHDYYNPGVMQEHEGRLVPL